MAANGCDHRILFFFFLMVLYTVYKFIESKLSYGVWSSSNYLLISYLDQQILGAKLWNLFKVNTEGTWRTPIVPLVFRSSSKHGLDKCSFVKINWHVTSNWRRLSNKLLHERGIYFRSISIVTVLLPQVDIWRS